MKTLKKIKLTQLNKVELDVREQNRLLGGAHCCICNCYYSGIMANSSSNRAGGVSGLIPSSGGGFGVGSFS